MSNLLHGVSEMFRFLCSREGLEIRQEKISIFLLVSFTLKGGEKFALQVSNSEIGDLIAWSASTATLCGTNSCKKKSLFWLHTLFVTFDYLFWMHVNFSVKLLEKNEGRFENELPGKIVCMGLAFTAAFFKVFTWICNKQNPFNLPPCFSSFSSDSIFSSFSTL